MHETFDHTADLGLRIRAASLDTLFVEAAENSAEAGAAAEEAGGLVGGKFEGVVFGDVDAADLFELEEFAFNHFLGEIDQDVEDVEIAFLQGDVEGLHVEPVAGEDAAMIAPAGISGGAAAAGVGIIARVIRDHPHRVARGTVSRRAARMFKFGAQIDW